MTAGHSASTSPRRRATRRGRLVPRADAMAADEADLEVAVADAVDREGEGADAGAVGEAMAAGTEEASARAVARLGSDGIEPRVTIL